MEVFALFLLGEVYEIGLVFNSATIQLDLCVVEFLFFFG